MNQSIDKAHRLIELLMLETPLSLGQLAGQAGMHRSSAHRLLATLQTFKWVEQDPDKRYRLGLGAIMLGEAALSQRSIVRVAMPHMKGLVAEINESASLVLYQDCEAYHVASVEAPRSMRASPQRPGTKVPLHCSGSGKVMLANLDDDQLRAVLETLPLERRTVRTLTTRDQLKDALSCVRSDGYAVDDQELETGLICVAAPLRDHTSDVVGALSLSGHCLRIERYGVAHIAAQVMRTAAAISVELGLPEAGTSRLGGVQ